MRCLQKDNVKLRNITSDDASVLMELNNDPEIARSVVGNPQKVTFDEQMKWMNRIKTEQNTVRFMIIYDSIAVGTIIISDIKHEAKTGNINIKLLREYQGRGIGKNAINLALNYCFSDLDLFCVTAHVLEDNYASQALFEKIGFKKEGIFRARVLKNEMRKDLVSYSILHSEYK